MRSNCKCETDLAILDVRLVQKLTGFILLVVGRAGRTWIFNFNLAAIALSFLFVGVIISVVCVIYI